MRRYWLNEVKREPCANCGKENGGVMSSTSWGHNHMCCSNACGIRLGQKIENGMVNLKRSSLSRYFGLFDFDDKDEQIDNLRNRIKQLEYQLRKNGIKPMKYKLR